MTLQSALSKKIKHLMSEYNLSEADVAAKCGLHISTVRRVTRGKGKYTSPMTALKLVQGLSDSPEMFYEIFTELLSEENVPFP